MYIKLIVGFFEQAHNFFIEITNSIHELRIVLMRECLQLFLYLAIIPVSMFLDITVFVSILEQFKYLQSKFIEYLIFMRGIHLLFILSHQDLVQLFQHEFFIRSALLVGREEFV